MKATLTDKLAAYFMARPGRWIDGHELLPIAGTFGLRSRISDCRRRGMVVENRLSHYKARDGRTLTKTEYRYVVPALPFHADDTTDSTTEGTAA